MTAKALFKGFFTYFVKEPSTPILDASILHRLRLEEIVEEGLKLNKGSQK